VWVPQEGGWSTAIALPRVPNDHIVVPSLALLDTRAADFAVVLNQGNAAWHLSPTSRTANMPPDPDPRVTTHIDYFHCRAELDAPTLTISVAAPQPPQHFLLTVSAREFARTPDPGMKTTRRLIVAPISQLTAPRNLRHRICSPTSLLMVLDYHGIDASLAGVTRDCLHAPSGMFGVWPLAIRTAADAGLVAAVECFTSLDAIAPVLERGLPVVASIRFDSGTLPGAALDATGGHLVVVTGFDRDWVYINDPAAKDASAVPRQCPRDAFAAAWLARRGAAYIVGTR